MSKETAKPEEAKETKENLVAIEMTKDQRDEYVKFLAAKKKEKAPKEAEPLMNIDLRFEHIRTNQMGTRRFGPGPIDGVPESLAWTLVAQDQKMYEARLRELTNNGNLSETAALTRTAQLPMYQKPQNLRG